MAPSKLLTRSCWSALTKWAAAPSGHWETILASAWRFLASSRILSSVPALSSALLHGSEPQLNPVRRSAAPSSNRHVFRIFIWSDSFYILWVMGREYTHHKAIIQ